jgi:hypothetical protein
MIILVKISVNSNLALRANDMFYQKAMFNLVSGLLK